MKSDKVHISVCVCTYKRIKLLQKLVKSLKLLETGKRFTYSLVIVDNDYEKSAESSVEALRRHADIGIEYYCEPIQNISRARNRTLAHATGDYIAFIDDDEIADKNWLLELYEALQKYQSDGVLAPVKARFESSPPDWIVKGRFYEKPTHPNGHILTWQETRTSNALIKREIISKRNDWFREEFGRGGEDKDFFRRLIEKNYVFVWTNSALVYEIIPPERWTRSFMIKRALLRGKMSLLDPSFDMLSIAKSVIAVAGYTCLLPLFQLAGHHVLMKYLIKNFDHIGKLIAFLGVDLIKQKYVMK